MNCQRLVGLLLAALASLPAMATTQSTAPQHGISDRTPGLKAFVHARLMLRPGKIIEDGTLVVRNGVIQAASEKVNVPAGAAVIDLAGKTIYPGFIDPWTDYGLAPKKANKTDEDEAHSRGPHSWNPRAHPERSAADLATPDAKRAAALRKLGFTAVASAPDKGIWRGQAAVVSLANADNLNAVLLAGDVAQFAAFETTGWDSSGYPSSLMGSIALVRQTLLDTGWYRKRRAWERRHPDAARIEINHALEALQPVLDGKQPVFFATDNELDYARTARVAAEFGLKRVLLGDGHEHRRVQQLKQAGVPVVLPLKLPEAPAVENPDRGLDIDLATLAHWRMAPYNARILVGHDVPIAFTTHGMDKPGKHFRANLRKMIESGLSPADALAALTIAPARMLGVADRLGTLEKGKQAQFLVADRDLLRDEDARIYAVWIDGERYPLADREAADPRGKWQLVWQGAKGPTTLEINGKDKLSAKVGETSFPVRVDDGRLLLYVPGKLLGVDNAHVAVSATLGQGRWHGKAALPGASIAVTATRSAEPEHKPLPAWTQAPLPDLDYQRWPAGAHGRHGLPEQPDAVLVRNARIWTQGPKGILEHADLLVENGHISAVGQNLDAPAGADIIDGTGKQVTPGIIDAHSHIAIAGGVNEGTHAVTSEVRIGDVLDPTDITIYRQLAGGTTTSQLLHGSANPIGGQSQIIKLRWGADAAGLKFRRAPKTIKFALGENVKQSNWGPKYTKRYPQTRMGVPELISDSFLAARDYGEALQAGHADDGGPLRRNLRLEALWEVLQDERLVQIHSYRQDEILAFVRVAERFGIVPTFQHVLEGYKVANAIAELGAGASTFSDWWAYKMEVYDAIPWNGAIMDHQGVTVSFNSDSGELARRLNTEAAKAVHYGGLAPAEALAFVTINPAKQLHIDDYVGSLEPGKDADFVIWNGSPLSPLSRAEQTWVDGRKYFDRQADRKANATIRERRSRLIAAALPERVKALDKDDKNAKEDQDDSTHTPAPSRTALLCARLAEIGIYHDSLPVAACAEGEVQ